MKRQKRATTKKPVDLVGLKRDLGFLADTVYFAPVLRAVLGRATSYSRTRGVTRVTFGREGTWFVKGRSVRAGDLVLYDSVKHLDTTAVRRLLRWAPVLREVLFDGAARTVWVEHPTLSNASGRPALFAVELEAKNEVDPCVLNPGALFLHRVVTRHGWPIDLPPTHLTAPAGQ